MLQRIKEMARNKGWSMSFVASQLGLSSAYFTDVKNGKAKILPDRLDEIAKILETTPEYLNGLTDNPSPRPSADPPTHTIVIPARNGKTMYRQLTPEQWERYNKLIEAAMPEILDDSEEDF